MKIGLFDSGLGGLTILRAVAQTLPTYDYLYFGDTAHLPYGDKSEEEVYRLTKQGVQTLFSHDCVLVIIACNTASAETLRRLQDTYLPHSYPKRRILGVIVPTIETLLESRTSHALLLATERTVQSGKYERELAKRSTLLKLSKVATSPLVGFIEAGQYDEAVAYASETIVAALQQQPDIDICVLGCTHYTVLKTTLRQTFPQLQFVSQDEIIPTKLAWYLKRHPEIASQVHHTKVRDVILSEPTSSYDEIVAQLLGDTLS